jgi:uncharacterized damage-inducible protein DinB
MALGTRAALAEIRDNRPETYASNDAMNQLILSRLDPRAWRAQPPGQKGSGRAIAGLFAHLHNTRRWWLKNCAASAESAATRSLPLHHEAGRCRAQEKRSAAPANVVGCSLGRSESPRFKVPSRPAGGTMCSPYVFSHEAHNRGQILMLSHQLGYRVPEPNICQWEKLWKQAGLTTRPC